MYSHCTVLVCVVRVFFALWAGRATKKYNICIQMPRLRMRPATFWVGGNIYVHPPTSRNIHIGKNKIINIQQNSIYAVLLSKENHKVWNGQSSNVLLEMSFWPPLTLFPSPLFWAVCSKTYHDGCIKCIFRPYPFRFGHLLYQL